MRVLSRVRLCGGLGVSVLSFHPHHRCLPIPHVVGAAGFNCSCGSDWFVRVAHRTERYVQKSGSKLVKEKNPNRLLLPELVKMSDGPSDISESEALYCCIPVQKKTTEGIGYCRVQPSPITGLLLLLPCLFHRITYCCTTGARFSRPCRGAPKAECGPLRTIVVSGVLC